MNTMTFGQQRCLPVALALLLSIAPGLAAAQKWNWNWWRKSPSIEGEPQTTVEAYSAYSFSPTASDPNGDPLTFSIANRPPWASFDVATGKLTGAPINKNAGQYAGIAISVSDGRNDTSLPTFAIEVLANHAPEISGQPATTVAPDQFYRFTPSAEDPENKPLRFVIANRPDWAQFDTASGQLSGRPGFYDAGQYENIRIRVTDGLHWVGLPMFSIRVEGDGVRLSWTAPAENTDGSTLTNLAGYRVYYTGDGHPTMQSIDVQDPTRTSLVIETLEQDVWHFGLTAVNEAGIESGLSNMVSFDLRGS